MNYWFSQKSWVPKILITQVIKSYSLKSLTFFFSVSGAGLNCGEMTVELVLAPDSGVNIDPATPRDADQGHQFSVHHLPPLKLQFSLPSLYPSQVSV